MQETLVKIVDIQRITLAPNEWLVINLPRDIHASEFYQAVEIIRAAFGTMASRVLILRAGDTTFTKIAFDEQEQTCECG